ncbi:MAG: DUF1275 family protein [Planctomycetes bacterium]|nr:DUF1275 family protein [Planctomycetota bacterium]
MFVKHAHSYTQQARLAITLSWIAGYTNILTLITCGQATSHISGTVSQLGRDVAEGRLRGGTYLLALIGAFVIGAALSGFLTELGRRARWRSIYVLPMAVEAGMLAVFALLVDWEMIEGLDPDYAKLWLTVLPAAAMGLQNATITRISGGVVRTTHVTGVTTDLGLEGGQWLLRKLERNAPPPAIPVSGGRLLLLSSILGSFLVGSGLGAFAFAYFPAWSMIPAVLFLLWIILQDVWYPIGDIHSSADAGGHYHEVLPAEIAVFHVKAGSDGRRRKARMPDLVSWADHLDEKVEIVVLDIAEFAHLDMNSALEIRALMKRLEKTNQGLVLAGVHPGDHALLREAGVEEALDASNILGNLDLASARALNLLEERAASAESAPRRGLGRPSGAP